jgi:triacylglycerol lipase
VDRVDGLAVCLSAVSVSERGNRNPVVLLHGIGDTSRVFDRLTRYLKERGWMTHGLDLIPNTGKAGLDELAVQVDTYIESTFAPEQKSDLVGFSMGGVVARYYLQRLSGLNRTSRLITISSPHRGTLTAFLGWNRGARQLRPGSAFLADLAQDSHVLSQIDFTSIWTPWDLMILPPHSSLIPHGSPVRLRVPTHWHMLRNPQVFRAVETALLR